MNVDNVIMQIDNLQKKLNEAIIKKQTQLSKKNTIDQEVEQLQNKCQDQFGCSIKELVSKKESLEEQMALKINELKEILGIA